MLKYTTPMHKHRLLIKQHALMVILCFFFFFLFFFCFFCFFFFFCFFCFFSVSDATWFPSAPPALYSLALFTVAQAPPLDGLCFLRLITRHI